jgi:mannitol-1-phosphate/altronate dehydrogenase
MKTAAQIKSELSDTLLTPAECGKSKFLLNTSHATLCVAIMDVLADHPEAAEAMNNFLIAKKTSAAAAKEQRRLEGVEKRKRPQRKRHSYVTAKPCNLLPDDIA